MVLCETIVKNKWWCHVNFHLMSQGDNCSKCSIRKLLCTPCVSHKRGVRNWLPLFLDTVSRWRTDRWGGRAKSTEGSQADWCKMGLTMWSRWPTLRAFAIRIPIIVISNCLFTHLSSQLQQVSCDGEPMPLRIWPHPDQGSLRCPGCSYLRTKWTSACEESSGSMYRAGCGRGYIPK